MSGLQPVSSNLGPEQTDGPREIPINDPEQERRVLEQKGWAGHYRFLAKRTGCQRFGFGPGEYAERISELYRRCFEPENDNASRAGLGRGKLNALSDFAGHFPHLIFRAKWVQTLMDFKGWDTDILRALANGFRAASRLPMHQLRISRLEAARIALSSTGPGSITEALGEAVEMIDFAILKQERRRKGAGKKLPPVVAECIRVTREHIERVGRDIAEKYPAIEPYRKAFIRHLERGHIYQAKVLLVSKLFRVSPRALQRQA